MIEETQHPDDEFISDIFIRPKKEPGAYKSILNLKKLNEYIIFHHFKMNTLTIAINMITPSCYLKSIDIKVAYYGVPVGQEDRRWLKFQFENTLYCYTCLPNDLASEPRIYTKICEPVFATLGKMGITVMGYIDDTLLKSDSVQEARKPADIRFPETTVVCHKFTEVSVETQPHNNVSGV